MLMRAIVLALCAAAGHGSQALAGGDEYDGANDTAGAGPAYFGFVRDTRGSPVANAVVLLRPKSGNPVSIKTDVLGVYRSHINKNVQPDDVQVSCEKPGYKQAKVVRRTPPGSKNMYIQTECTLQRL